MKNLNEETLDASGKVYEVENDILDGKLQEGPNKYSKLAQMEGKTIVAAKHTATGMTAVAYKDNKSGEIIIAYCGTNPSRDSIADIYTDVTIATDVVQLQTDDAVAFYIEVKSNNPGSSLIITGHSLGGGLANEVNVRAGGENKSITYNAAPLSRVGRISTLWLNKTNFTNYRTDQDPLTSLGQILPGAYPNGLKTIGYGGHDLKEFNDYDAQAEFYMQKNAEKVNQFVESVVQSSQVPKIPEKVPVDTNGDSKVDTVVEVDELKKYKNLFTGSETQGNVEQEIKITPELLFSFANTLENIANTEVPKLISNIQIMLDKNESVGSQYTARILNCTSNIENLLKDQGLTTLVNCAVLSYEELIENQKTILLSANLENASFVKELKEGSYEGEDRFIKDIKDLAPVMRQLDSDLTVVHTKVEYSSEGKGHYASGSGFSNTTITKTPIALLVDLKAMLSSLDGMIAEEFKGDGNRAIFNDGLQGAIKVVLNVQKKNLSLVQSAIRNAASITRIIASNFQNRDQAIKAALDNKEINPRITELETIPKTFPKYLEDCAVFDDVMGVFNAWNGQIKRASQNIEAKFLNKIVEVVSQHKSSHDKVYKGVVTGRMITNDLMNEMNTKITKISYSSKYVPTFSSSYFYEEKTAKSEDAGTVRSYIGNEQYTISKLNQMFQKAETNLISFTGSLDKFKGALSTEKSQIDILIRDEIYKSVDLDEIESIQHLLRDVMSTMMSEFSNAINIIQTSQKGSAIAALINEFRDVIKLLHYFSLLSEKSFI